MKKPTVIIFSWTMARAGILQFPIVLIRFYLEISGGVFLFDLYKIIFFLGIDMVKDMPIFSVGHIDRCSAKHGFLSWFFRPKYCVCDLIGKEVELDKKTWILNRGGIVCYQIKGTSRSVLEGDLGGWKGIKTGGECGI